MVLDQCRAEIGERHAASQLSTLALQGLGLLLVFKVA